MSSLASREARLDEERDRRNGDVVSNQVSSLASREPVRVTTRQTPSTRFQSSEFPSE